MSTLSVYAVSKWKPTFAVLPHRTVTNKWVWLRFCFYRDVMVYDGVFIDEPDVQWARDVFEILETIL